MTPELAALATLILIQIVFGLTVTAIVAKRTGVDYVLGSREDGTVDLTTGFVGRMHRARLNAFEAIVYFTPTVMIVVLSGAGSALTATLSWAFVALRVIYIACYALDLNPWRSMVWLSGIACIAVMLLGAVL